MRAGFSGGVGREGSRGGGTLRPPELCSAAGPSLTAGETEGTDRGSLNTAIPLHGTGFILVHLTLMSLLTLLPPPLTPSL